VAAAGHADGLKLDLFTPIRVPGMVRRAGTVLYAEMAKAAGIEINVHTVTRPAESYWDDVWLKNAPCLTLGLGTMRPAARGPRLCLSFRLGFQRNALEAPGLTTSC
jgi:hypothetical protein